MSRTWRHSVKVNAVESYFQNPLSSVCDCSCLSLGLLWRPWCLEPNVFPLCFWSREAAPGDRVRPVTTACAPGPISSPLGRTRPFWALPQDTVVSWSLLSETSQNYSPRFTHNTTSCPEIASFSLSSIFFFLFLGCKFPQSHSIMNRKVFLGLLEETTAQATCRHQRGRPPTSVLGGGPAQEAPSQLWARPPPPSPPTIRGSKAWLLLARGGGKGRGRIVFQLLREGEPLGCFHLGVSNIFSAIPPLPRGVVWEESHPHESTKNRAAASCSYFHWGRFSEPGI